MKRYKYILPVVVMAQFTAFAQTAHFIPRESIQDTAIGWMSVYKFTGARRPVKVDDKLAGAIERKLAKEKDQAMKSWPEGNALTNALAAVEGRYQKRVSALQNARAKYLGRLEETAEVSRLQPDEMLENNPDVFGDTAAAPHRYPVYKIDPALAALATSDQPQWILVSWDGNITQPVAKQLQEAILNNFNFDYAYDFVFNPEKVKGQPYTPLRAPSLK